MPSSSGPSRGQVGRVAAVLLGLLGLACLLYPVVSAEGRADGGAVFFGVVGVFMLAVAGVVWVVRGTPPDAARRTSLASAGGAPALVVRLRPTTPVVMLTLGLAGAALFVVAALGVGLGSGGAFFLPLVLLFGLQVPDAARALLRRPGLTLDARALAYRGWTVDAELAWEDVSSVRLDTSDPRRPRLLVSGRPEAASWRATSHRIVLPLDRMPRRPEILVQAAALDEPTRVEVLVQRLAAAAPAERASYLDQDGVAFLSGGR